MQDGRDAGFIRRREDAFRVAAVAGGVFQIPLGNRPGAASLDQISRITGMISGRREVSFTM